MIIILGMLVLSFIAPFVSLYAVSLIKKRDHQGHARIQRGLFAVCVLGVVILELHIRFSGGSGSLISNGTYTSAPYFMPLLIAHIIGAVLTYVVWAVQIVVSGRKMKVAGGLPGSFSSTHRALGYGTIAGMFYTAITALAVCTLAFFL